MDSPLGIFSLLVAVGVLLFAVSFLFDRLPGRSRTDPRTITAGSGSVQRAVSINPPAVFDPRQIQEDLARLVEAPTLFLQYKEKVLTRYTRRNQRALIQEMVAVYTDTAKLVESGLGVELTQKQHEEKVAELDAKIAKHHADQAEEEVRAEEAAHPKPEPKAPEPPKPEPTREEKIQRIETRLRAIEQRLDLRDAVNVEGLSPRKQREHVEEGNDLGEEKRQLKKKLEGLRKLVV